MTWTPTIEMTKIAATNLSRSGREPTSERARIALRKVLSTLVVTTNEAKAAARIESGSVNLQRNRLGSTKGIPIRSAFARKSREITHDIRRT